MATIVETTDIARNADEIWDAVRDVGALHRRVAPGLVADCVLNSDGSERIVTFANGMVLPETIVAIDDGLQRVVWSARSDQWTHHNGSLQVTALPDGAGCLVTWVADILPDEAALAIQPLMALGLATMKAYHEGQTGGVEP